MVLGVLKLTILGSLWVPPAPGKSPSSTSGTPNTVFLSFVATLYWHAMASFREMKEKLEVRKYNFNILAPMLAGLNVIYKAGMSHRINHDLLG